MQDRRSLDLPEDGEQSFHWGSPDYPHPYTTTYSATSNTWERDR